MNHFYFGPKFFFFLGGEPALGRFSQCFFFQFFNIFTQPPPPLPHKSASYGPEQELFYLFVFFWHSTSSIWLKGYIFISYFTCCYSLEYFLEKWRWNFLAKPTLLKPTSKFFKLQEDVVCKSKFLIDLD